MDSPFPRRRDLLLGLSAATCITAEETYAQIDRQAVRRASTGPAENPAFTYKTLAEAQHAAVKSLEQPSVNTPIRVQNYVTEGDGGGFNGVITNADEPLNPDAGRIRPVDDHLDVRAFGPLSPAPRDAATNSATLQKAINFAASVSATLFVPKGVWPHIGLYFYRDPIRNPSFPIAQELQSAVSMRGASVADRRDVRINAPSYGTILEYIGGGETGYYMAKLFSQATDGPGAIYRSSGMALSNITLAGTSTGYLVRCDGLTNSRWADRVSVVQRGSGSGVLIQNAWFVGMQRLQVDLARKTPDNNPNPYYRRSGVGIDLRNVERSGGNVIFEQCDATGFGTNWQIGKPDFSGDVGIINDVRLYCCSAHSGQQGVVLGRGARQVSADMHIEGHDETGLLVKSNAGRFHMRAYMYNPDARIADVQLGTNDSGPTGWFSGGELDLSIIKANVAAIRIDNIKGTRGVRIKGAANPANEASVGVIGPGGKYAGRNPGGGGVILDGFDVGTFGTPYQNLSAEVIILDQEAWSLPPLNSVRTVAPPSAETVSGPWVLNPASGQPLRPLYLLRAVGQDRVVQLAATQPERRTPTAWTVVQASADSTQALIIVDEAGHQMAVLRAGQGALCLSGPAGWIVK